MEKQELHQQLTHLHQELSTIDNVDESTKEMLVTVMQDIAKVLTGEPVSDAESPAPTSDSLREMMTEFEAEHPKLAQTLGQLADGLANLGI
jgi:hypothetical protein